MKRALFSLISLFSSVSVMATDLCLTSMNGLVIPRFEDVLVVGDIHGNLQGALHAIRTIQRQRGAPFQYAVQLGDLGYYPDPAVYSHTSKNSRKGELEMGVHQYLVSPDRFKKFMKEGKGCDSVTCQWIFVRGNHDDTVALHGLPKKETDDLVPVDRDGRLLYLRDGRSFDFRLPGAAGGSAFTVAGYGGIDPSSRAKAYRREPSIRFDTFALDKLLKEGLKIDLLLTHQGPHGTKSGSQEIDALVELLQPRIHLHGHAHAQSGPTLFGTSQSFGVGKVEPVENASAYNGAFGVLRYHRDGRMEFLSVDEAYPK